MTRITAEVGTMLDNTKQYVEACFIRAARATPSARSQHPSAVSSSADLWVHHDIHVCRLLPWKLP